MAKVNEKRRRKNWLKRVVRGAVKAGNSMPGYSWKYTEPNNLDAAYNARGKALREEVEALLGTDYMSTHAGNTTHNR
jgi:hypothetical protein